MLVMFNHAQRGNVSHEDDHEALPPGFERIRSDLAYNVTILILDIRSTHVRYLYPQLSHRNHGDILFQNLGGRPVHSAQFSASFSDKVWGALILRSWTLRKERGDTPVTFT